MKPKLFIGSSAESLFIAKAMEALLSVYFEVKVWDRAFNANEYFLERLQKELFLTDFALFIIAPDDQINKRGKKLYFSRDNVIFELGMFIGALGLKKAYFIVADIIKNGKTLSITLPSDLDGIKKTRIKLSLDSNGKLLENDLNQASFKTVAESLKDNLLNNQSQMTLSLLPSTSLAIGYYRNFILQACKELSVKKDFEIDGVFYDLTKDIFDFYIIIPDNGSDASHEGYTKFVNRNSLKQVEIKAVDSPRTFPFFIKSDIKNGRIQLYDLPTTLRSSRETIRLVLPMQTNANEIVQLELKEIANFKSTIEFLLKEPESAGFRDNIHLIAASELFKTIP